MKPHFTKVHEFFISLEVCPKCLGKFGNFQENLSGSCDQTQFHQQAAYTPTDPESAKKTVKLSIFFALLGSEQAKAARKMLIKLTPKVG